MKILLLAKDKAGKVGFNFDLICNNSTKYRHGEDLSVILNITETDSLHPLHLEKPWNVILW